MRIPKSYKRCPAKWWIYGNGNMGHARNCLVCNGRKIVSEVEEKVIV